MPNNTEFQLKDVIKTFLKHKWIIISATLILTVITYVVALNLPSYYSVVTYDFSRVLGKGDYYILEKSIYSDQFHQKLKESVKEEDKTESLRALLNRLEESRDFREEFYSIHSYPDITISKQLEERAFMLIIQFELNNKTALQQFVPYFTECFSNHIKYLDLFTRIQGQINESFEKQLDLIYQHRQSFLNAQQANTYNDLLQKVNVSDSPHSEEYPEIFSGGQESVNSPTFFARLSVFPVTVQKTLFASLINVFNSEIEREEIAINIFLYKIECFSQLLNTPISSVDQVYQTLQQIQKGMNMVEKVITLSADARRLLDEEMLIDIQSTIAHVKTSGTKLKADVSISEKDKKMVIIFVLGIFVYFVLFNLLFIVREYVRN